jgi:hypothetical protein
MPMIDIHLEGEGCWPDLYHRKVIDCMGDNQPPIGIALLNHGMTSGKSSVTIRIDLPDGSSVITETSLALFIQAAELLKIGDERNNKPGGFHENPGQRI